ncbi:hypothetical protein CCH79_00003890 [Gambusia affinis]|uniref:Uncharacterized protein n=1 Tax=Gambusia affinis TaxID=33528 RepID=A0A315VAD0_GAMAF|nr:hypothetical protein CCH79_00003890 [Gambusia affinis]
MKGSGEDTENVSPLMSPRGKQEAMDHDHASNYPGKLSHRNSLSWIRLEMIIHRNKKEKGKS